MERSRLSRWVAALMLVIALAPSAASAQEDDTLSITGTFGMDQLYGAVGSDLAEVYANGNDHWWKLTLSGVSYSHDDVFVWEDFGQSGEVYRTRVHASSFTFEFFGPDAAILNDVVSSQLTQEDIEVLNEFWVDTDGWLHSQGFWAIRLDPSFAEGVSFQISDYSPEFPADEDGYPLIQPQRLEGAPSVIRDHRDGEFGSGALVSLNDIVDIGSAEPPAILPLTLSIEDASVREGNKGTTWLDLRVTLSGSSNGVVTVNYATADGTAVARMDYSATSGTLTFQPGQTVGTISVPIKGDRKREPDENVSVQLSGAVGAAIDDGIATGTILNDD